MAQIQTSTQPALFQEQQHRGARSIKVAEEDKLSHRHFLVIPSRPVTNKFLAMKEAVLIKERHKQALKKAKPSIDNTPPKVYSHLQCREKQIQQQEDRLREIHRLNGILLRRIAFQHSSHVDRASSSYIKYYNYCTAGGILKSNPVRTDGRKKLSKDNEKILQRIEEQPPLYAREELERQRLTNLKYLASISQYPKSYIKQVKKKEEQLDIHPPAYKRPISVTSTRSSFIKERHTHSRIEDFNNSSINESHIPARSKTPSFKRPVSSVSDKKVVVVPPITPPPVARKPRPKTAYKNRPTNVVSVTASEAPRNEVTHTPVRPTTAAPSIKNTVVKPNKAPQKKPSLQILHHSPSQVSIVSAFEDRAGSINSMVSLTPSNKSHKEEESFSDLNNVKNEVVLVQFTEEDLLADFEQDDEEVEETGQELEHEGEFKIIKREDVQEQLGVDEDTELIDIIQESEDPVVEQEGDGLEEAPAQEFELAEAGEPATEPEAFNIEQPNDVDEEEEYQQEEEEEIWIQDDDEEYRKSFSEFNQEGENPQIQNQEEEEELMLSKDRDIKKSKSSLNESMRNLLQRAKSNLSHKSNKSK